MRSQPLWTQRLFWRGPALASGTVAFAGPAFPSPWSPPLFAPTSLRCIQLLCERCWSGLFPRLCSARLPQLIWPKSDSSRVRASSAYALNLNPRDGPATGKAPFRSDPETSQVSDASFCTRNVALRPRQEASATIAGTVPHMFCLRANEKLVRPLANGFDLLFRGSIPTPHAIALAWFVRKIFGNKIRKAQLFDVYVTPKLSSG